MTEAGVKVTATVDRPLVRDLGPSTRYLRVELEAPERARGERRPPVNLGLVLDRSGSMAGRKIEVARQAVDRAIGVLGEGDR